MRGTKEQLLKALKPIWPYKIVGEQIKLNCPRCENELGMLHDKFNLEVIYSPKRNFYAYHCWACNQHGTLYGVIQKYGYKEYLGLFKTEKVDEIDFQKDEVRKEIELPRYLKSVLSVEEARDYLFSRGVTEKIILQRQIGYCYGGVYNGYIVFPSFNIDGDLTSVVYHDFKNKQYRRKKGNNFICFYENLIDRYSLITLVEGIFDALVIPNAIPLLGNEISKELLDFLADTNVLFIPDTDLDEKIIQNKLKQLKSVCKDVKLHCLNSIEGKDVNEIYCKKRNNIVKIFKKYYI